MLHANEVEMKSLRMVTEGRARTVATALPPRPQHDSDRAAEACLPGVGPRGVAPAC